MKIPCEDCITLAMCINIANTEETPNKVLRNKCSLYDDFVKFYISLLEVSERHLYSLKLRSILRYSK